MHVVMYLCVCVCFVVCVCLCVCCGVCMCCGMCVCRGVGWGGGGGADRLALCMFVNVMYQPACVYECMIFNNKSVLCVLCYAYIHLEFKTLCWFIF